MQPYNLFTSPLYSIPNYFSTVVQLGNKKVEPRVYEVWGFAALFSIYGINYQKGKQCMNKSVSLSLLLIVLACLSTALMLRNTPFNHPTSKQQLDHQLDAFMHNVSYCQYDNQGLLHSYLNTPLIVHYPLEDTSYFNRPNYLIYTDKRVPWTVVANQGKNQGKVHQVYLWNHVRIHKSQQPTEPETTIVTRNLMIFPSRSLVKTDKDVIITQLNSTVQAIGMTADLKKGTIRLLSHAIGIYESKPTGPKSSRQRQK